MKRVDFVDLIRKDIEQLRLDEISSIELMESFIIFLMNLSSCFDVDLNAYIAESDVTKFIFSNIEKTFNI